MHHTWNNKLVGAVLLSLAIAGGVAEANANEPIIDMRAVTEQTTADRINETIRAHCPSVMDIEAIAEEADGQWVRERIASYSLPQAELYSRGKLLDDEDRQRLLDNMNLSPIGKMQAIGYGVAVRRANVKGLPTGRGLFTSADDTERDILQQGTLDPCETVRLLHVSQDRRFYFVQGQTICGWVFVGDIAVAKKSEWKEYHAPTEFVTVISRGERIKQTRETVYAQMGTRLPLMREKENEYKIKLPVRGNHGKLIDVETMIDKSDGYIIGHLDYTADNIAKLADAYVGAPYGYRGLKNSEDNSGMITDIYRAMGIILPRDADEMKTSSLLLQTYDDTAVIAIDGENALAVVRGDGITVVGKSADGKTIGSYPLDETVVGGDRS